MDFGSLGEDFPSLAPTIDQPFLIGDGLDAAGAAQAFLVPDAARVLVIGILDATAFHGSPDHYGDNTGSVTTNVAVQDNVWGV